MVSAVVYVLLLAACCFKVHGNEHTRFVVDKQTNLTTLVAKLVTEVEELKSQQTSSDVNVTLLQQESKQLNKDLVNTQRELQTAKSIIEHITYKQGSWSTYIRWGKSTCPNDKTELVYSGYAAGSNWNDPGAATNYICLVKDPYLTGNGSFNQGAQIHLERVYFAMDTLMVPVAQVNDAKNKRIDIKSGEIYLMQDIDGHPIKHKMYMKVFRSDYEHHAQIYTDAGYVFLNDVLSLRNCDVKVDKDLKRITISGDNISIRSVAADKVVLLEVNSLVEIMEWEQSLKPSSGLLLDSEFSPQTSPAMQKRSIEF